MHKFWEKSRNTNFSSRGAANYKRAPSGATRRAEKSVLRPKKSKLTKSFPNFLKFGLNFHHQALCWAKEASAKIWSLSCLLRRFNALFNFAFMFLSAMDEWDWWGEGLILVVGFWEMKGFMGWYLGFGMEIRVWGYLTRIWNSGIRDLGLVD